MHLEPFVDQEAVDLMTNVGAIAIAECQLHGYGFNELVNLLHAYRYAKDSCDLGWQPDLAAICTTGTLVCGLPAGTPVPVLCRQHPYGAGMALLRKAIAELHIHATTDDFLGTFLSVSPFASGNSRTAWIVQNWLDDTLDNPMPLRLQ